MLVFAVRWKNDHRGSSVIQIKCNSYIFWIFLICEELSSELSVDVLLSCRRSQLTWCFHHRCIRTVFGITNQRQWEERISSAMIRQWEMQRPSRLSW